MALTQFTSDWNNSFHLKISVGDIKKPTQSFLYGVFAFFLGTINIDCEKMKAKMDERHFKIWLIKYYNDFFKTCNPKCYPLYYGDLLQPESKKVLEILRFLLNFHLFHNAVKTEIVDTTNFKIDMHNQWLSRLNQLKINQEEAKIRSEQKEALLKETTRLIAEYKQQLEELTAKNTRLAKEAEEAEKEVCRIRVENIDLASQIDGLTPSIVTELEFTSLLKAIQDTENAISELNAMDVDIQSKNKCLAQEISLFTAEIDALSENEDMNSAVELMEKERDEKKNLAELIQKVKEFRIQINHTAAKRLELSESIKSMEAQLSTKRNDLALLLENCQTKQRTMESECKRSLTEAANMEKTLDALDQKVELMKITQKELIARGLEVIDHLQSSEIIKNKKIV